MYFNCFNVSRCDLLFGVKVVLNPVEYNVYMESSLCDEEELGSKNNLKPEGFKALLVCSEKISKRITKF